MTPFAKKVYRVVLSIPLGQVRTYKWVAQKAGRPGAWRAVGTILNKNPFPVIIPCHRVIKSNNISGGYVFGKKRKKELLGLEGRIKECLANRK
ncbi:MAG: MGMT family protein [Candidatus Omnitrophica bacterium]|nr:MGMT family protein [Candidatus Omnitrophota bacterium]